MFGLRASAEGLQLYEWQVRALLEELGRLPGALAAGLTFEERDRFRAAGVLAIPAGGTAAFEAARRDPGSPGGVPDEALVMAFAPVVAIVAGGAAS